MGRYMTHDLQCLHPASAAEEESPTSEVSAAALLPQVICSDIQLNSSNAY